MSLSCRLTETFVGWHNIEVFAILPIDRPVAYVLVPSRWVGWEPGCLLLVPSLFVLSYYSGLVVCGSEAEKAHIWHIATT